MGDRKAAVSAMAFFGARTMVRIEGQGGWTGGLGRSLSEGVGWGGVSMPWSPVPLLSRSNSPQPRCRWNCWHLSRPFPSWAAASPLWPPCSLSCCTSTPGMPRARPAHHAAQHVSFVSACSPRGRRPQGRGQPHRVGAVGSLPASTSVPVIVCL